MLGEQFLKSKNPIYSPLYLNEILEVKYFRFEFLHVIFSFCLRFLYNMMVFGWLGTPVESGWYVFGCTCTLVPLDLWLFILKWILPFIINEFPWFRGIDYCLQGSVSGWESNTG